MGNPKVTEYTYRLTVCVPMNLLEVANELACLVGESVHDLQTFEYPTHEDATGNLYSCISTVAKATTLGYAQSPTIPDPPHAVGLVDRERAQAEWLLLGQPGHILFRMDKASDAPQPILEQLGLTPLQEDAEDDIVAESGGPTDVPI